MIHGNCLNNEFGPLNFVIYYEFKGFGFEFKQFFYVLIRFVLEYNSDKKIVRYTGQNSSFMSYKFLVSDI